MKATLEFNLPEDREEHELALKGHLLAIAVEDILNDVFRKRLKYDDYSNNDVLAGLYKQNTGLVRDVIEEIKGEIINILDSRDVLDLV